MPESGANLWPKGLKQLPKRSNVHTEWLLDDARQNINQSEVILQHIVRECYWARKHKLVLRRLS